MIPRVALSPSYSIPRLIVGCWQHSAGHSTSPRPDDEIFSVWDASQEQGADTFDCADIYTGVEALIGRYLAARRARGLLAAQVHTKFVPDLSGLPAIDRRYVTRIIDRSLERLQVDRLDLVQLHWWDYSIPRYLDTLGWLDELRRAGKIRNLGVTNFDTVRLTELLATGVPIVSIQLQYSLLDRRPEHGMVELCAARGIGILCYGTLAGGFLSEHWLGCPAPASDFENRSLVKYRLIIDECGGWSLFQNLLRALGSIAAKHRVGIGDIAMRAVLDRPGVSAVIVGLRSDHGAATIARPLSVVLDAGDGASLATATDALQTPVGDVYSLERIRGGAHAKIMRYEASG